MSTEQKDALHRRHRQANAALDQIATARLQQMPVGTRKVKIYSTVGAKLGVSSQTVYNYVAGKGKDGYLTEALTKAFKALKP